MATLLIESLKGAQAEVAAQATLQAKALRAGRLARLLAGELRSALALSPHAINALRVWSALPAAGSPAAGVPGAPPFGVVVHPAQRYGPKPRHLCDVYVPAHLHQQQQQQGQHQHQQPPTSHPAARVAMFVHGGIWVTGETFHFAALAVRLAAAGLIVLVPSYTLYPAALAGEMASEVLAAYKWAASSVAAFGGDPRSITLLGHSAGGHLASLALLMLACQKSEAEQLLLLSGQQQQQQSQQQQQQQSQQQQQQPGQQRHLQQQQQESTDQQEPRDQWGQHWCAAADAPAYIAALPPPQLFVGMASVFDVPRHFEFETGRGVQGLSTMARACGGAGHWDAVSPAVLLRCAAAAAAAAAPVAAAQASGGGGGGGSGAPATGGMQLLGDVIPLKAGLEASPGPAASLSSSSSSDARQQQQLVTQVSPAGLPTGAAELRCPAAGVLRGLTAAAAAAHMPPCLIMSSLADHMVPWHEGAEMALALRSAGVPARHAIYESTLHNDFCLAWRPVRQSRQQQQQQQQEGAPQVPAAAASSSSSSAGDDSEVGLQPFARDLLAVLTGRVALRFGAASARATQSQADAVAALERAAGVQPLLPAAGQRVAAPRARL